MAKYRPRVPDAGKPPRERALATKGTSTVTDNSNKLTGKSASWMIMDDIYSDIKFVPPAVAADRMSEAKKGGGSSDAYDAMYAYMKAYGYASSGGLFSDGSRTSSAPDPHRALNAARQKVEQYLQSTDYGTGWDDVIGNEPARQALLEAIEHPVKHADLYAKYGMTPSKGVLLYGPPGCGKTMFGKAAADALSRLHGAKTELLVINGASIQSGYVGETEKTIRNIFAYARAYHAAHNRQLVIFIDEADAILPNRDRGYRYEASNVATFLTELDGMQTNGAFVILATNRPEAMDEALLRDGRCDRKIRVNRPTYEDAIRIADKHMTGKDWAQDVNGTQLADYVFDAMRLVRVLTNHDNGMTHHFLLSHIINGAMIVGLVERAKTLAMRRELAGGEGGLCVNDLHAAVDAVLAENKGLNHDYALREFVETVAIPFEMARVNNMTRN